MKESDEPLIIWNEDYSQSFLDLDPPAFCLGDIRENSICDLRRRLRYFAACLTRAKTLRLGAIPNLIGYFQRYDSTR